MKTNELAATPSHADEELHLATSHVRFKNILVATDFSPSADEAVRTGIAVARRFESSLFIAHVILPVIYPDQMGVVGPNMFEAQEKSAKEQLEALAFSPSLKCVPHKEMLMRYGPVVSTINDLVAEHNIDLVIVGTHGYKGVQKLMLGSVAEVLLRESRCPVMTVGPHVKRERMQYESILLAIDLSTNSLRAAQYAISLAKEMNAKVTLLNVVHPDRDDGRLNTVKHKETILTEMQQLLPADANLWCRPNLRVEEGDVAVQILAVAQQEEAELIVLSVRDSKPLSDHAPWATVSKIVSHAQCPVLTVRAHLK